MPRTVFSVPVGSSPLPLPSYTANYIPEDIDLFSDFYTSSSSSSSLALSSSSSSPAITFDLFTLAWILSLFALFFLTDNYTRTQRHDHAKWLDAQTEKLAYQYECNSRKEAESQQPSSAEAEQQQEQQSRRRQGVNKIEDASSSGGLAALFDGFASGASLMLAA